MLCSYSIVMFYCAHIVDLCCLNSIILQCSLPISFVFFVIMAWINIWWSYKLNMSSKWYYYWGSPFHKYWPSISTLYNTINPINSWRRVNSFMIMLFKSESVLVWANECTQMINISSGSILACILQYSAHILILIVYWYTMPSGTVSVLDWNALRCIYVEYSLYIGWRFKWLLSTVCFLQLVSSSIIFVSNTSELCQYGTVQYRLYVIWLHNTVKGME